MNGARFVETGLVQKMLKQRSYELHRKKIDEIKHQKKHEFELNNPDVLRKTQQIKVKSSRFQKSESNRRINESNQVLTAHILQIQEGKTSQFRGIWTVQNGRNQQYADTSIWHEGALGKRLHSPLRRKVHNQIEEENQQMYSRIDQNKQINIEKQQEIIEKYQKLRDHMTRIKSTKTLNSPQNGRLPALQGMSKQYSDSNLKNSKLADILLKSELNISKISKVE